MTFTPNTLSYLFKPRTSGTFCNTTGDCTSLDPSAQTRGPPKIDLTVSQFHGTKRYHTGDGFKISALGRSAASRKASPIGWQQVAWQQVVGNTRTTTCNRIFLETYLFSPRPAALKLKCFNLRLVACRHPGILTLTNPGPQSLWQHPPGRQSAFPESDRGECAARYTPGRLRWVHATLDHYVKKKK